MRIVSRAFPVGLLLATCALPTLGTPACAAIFTENFNDNSIDSALWTAYEYGTGPQIDETNQQLEISMPGSSSGGDFGVKLASNFRFRGDFDVQVDFRLLTWPFGNGVRMALGTDRNGLLPHPGVERISFGQYDYEGYPREVYLTDFLDGVAGVTGTSDMTGTLRLVRSGNTQTGYYYSSGWVAIHTGPAPAEDIGIMVAAFSAYQFMGWDVFAAFDNLVINSGELVDFPTPVHQTTWGSVRALYR